MARLLLLRHAKSAQGDLATADFDRPLAPGGARDARHMAGLIAAKGLVPDRILCSTALRTRETLAPMLEAWPGDQQVEYRDDLYRAAGTGYLGTIGAQGAMAHTLLVLGHNPMIHQTALQLTGAAVSGLAEALASGFPPGAAAVIEFDLARWRDIDTRAGHLVAFLRPGGG